MDAHTFFQIIPYESPAHYYSDVWDPQGITSIDDDPNELGRDLVAALGPIDGCDEDESIEIVTAAATDYINDLAIEEKMMADAYGE